MTNVFVGGLYVQDAANTQGDTFTGVIIDDYAQKETVADNKTLDDGDCGVIQNVTVDAKIVTLPATVVGYSYTIRNGGADGTVAVTVSPNASDKIFGNGFTATDNKDAINTKATAKKGDYIKLVGDGVNGWMITEVAGIWARE